MEDIIHAHTFMVEFRYSGSKLSLMLRVAVSYSVAKLAIVMLLRPRCKHMLLQMHSMNDPNQSYTVH